MDSKGLVALWRETLLAKKVLQGKTKGYTKHPQLKRFRDEKNPVELIDQYLSYVFFEAESRGYKFDRSKINWGFSLKQLQVTSGQLNFEKRHLLNKLNVRDQRLYKNLLECKEVLTHPQFVEIKGEIENWEIQ